MYVETGRLSTKHPRHTIRAVITGGEQSGYVGSCFGLPVVSVPSGPLANPNTAYSMNSVGSFLWGGGFRPAVVFIPRLVVMVERHVGSDVAATSKQCHDNM